MSSKYDIRELLRQKSALGSKISKNDPRYGEYSGAELNTALKMARIDTLEACGLIPKEISFMVKLYRTYLDYLRVAYFASVGTDVFTKLAFIYGDPTRVKSAIEKRHEVKI